MSHLLNVDEALAQILETITTLTRERIPLSDSLNRILADDVISDVYLPPFANSSMDGYAIRAEDSESASYDHPVQLGVTMDIPAGVAPEGRLAGGESARIMTGAPVPEGANAIIPVEDTDDDWNKETLTDLPSHIQIYRQVNVGDYIRPIGENIKQGDIVLKAGTCIRPQDIGMLASIGQASVSVIRRPRVVILSTGDELVEIDQPLSPGKIRDSNRYMLASLVEQSGAEAISLPIAGDDLESVRQLFTSAIDLEPNMMISSAGVSVGTADLVRTILDEIGAISFWRINLRPGKPLAFGHIRGIPFFGLPGNPVSAMVTFEVLVRPALSKMVSYSYHPTIIQAQIQEDLTSDGRRSYLRVILTHREGTWFASTTGTQSSGALMSMVIADGLMIVPEGITLVEAGSILSVQLLRSLGDIHV